MAASLELAAALDEWEMVEIEQVGLGLGFTVRVNGPGGKTWLMLGLGLG